MTKEQLANEYIKQGWSLLPPLGCVVRAKQPCDPEPREYRVDEIEIEIDLSFTLWQHGENEDDEYEPFDPENIIEFVSFPEDSCDDVSLLWRQLRNEDHHDQT
jgi:hypothetical protein